MEGCEFASQARTKGCEKRQRKAKDQAQKGKMGEKGRRGVTMGIFRHRDEGNYPGGG